MAMVPPMMMRGVVDMSGAWDEEFTAKTQRSGKDADEDVGKWEWVGLVGWRFQTLADAAGGGLDVWGLEEGGDDDDALCSGSKDSYI